VKHLTPLKSIRKKCIDCSGNQLLEVRLCPCETCSLWPYRMGRRPEHPISIKANEDARRDKCRARRGVVDSEHEQLGGESAA